MRYRCLTLLMTLHLTIILLLLSGCAGTGEPRWHDDAVRWLDTYRGQALGGESQLASSAFSSALREFRRGGDWDGLAIAQLTRCAVERVSDLPLAGCTAYYEQKPLGASRRNDAYAHWLAGDLALADIEHLPQAYRGVAAALHEIDQKSLAARLVGMESPLSKLVALAVVWRHLPDPQPALIECQLAAAKQGWLAAHRAYLKRELEILRERGDQYGVQDREKRLHLLD